MFGQFLEDLSSNFSVLKTTLICRVVPTQQSRIGDVKRDEVAVLGNCFLRDVNWSASNRLRLHDTHQFLYIARVSSQAERLRQSHVVEDRAQITEVYTKIF